MKNTEIVDLIIKKAWPDTFEITHKVDGSIFVEYQDGDVDCYESVYQLIFDHDFAMAFFGVNRNELPIEEQWKIQSAQSMYNFRGFETEDPQGAHWIDTTWQYHLMKMVLEQSPIKYLEQFLANTPPPYKK